MAFFKFRLPGQAAAEPQGNASNSPAESVDALRRRARHRLIGASVLVVLGVVGFPVLFDTQPRPVSVDIAVDIPDRATAKPLVDTSTPKPLSASAGLDAKEEVVDSKPEAKPETKPEAKVDIKPEVAVAGVAGAAAVAAVAPKAETKPEPVKAEVKTDAKADAKVEAKAAKPTDSKDAGRFVVQAGTFSDESKLRETRSKLEKAGISTYTQVIEGKEGRRVRVRVGPFTSRDEADKVARKIKQLSLQPQVLTL
ncbi:sporulation protein [Limnohabitans sp. MORI2]|jgi:DedD protein|uniref:SPOR domain-containing protein n=1 Tax=Limnohabitans sp. MORI2 TaxID=1751150 RepID=UPI002377B10B|nr:SPOR domain-containing protein [Limnohabitans sp. MORI2]BDU58781.1 sporulation protein [Limnohabitans sp. MORI2]